MKKSQSHRRWPIGAGGEVGVDLEVREAGDDEQGRVAEGFAIVVELLVGALEVAVVALCTPRRSGCGARRRRSLAGVGFGDALFKSVALADGVLPGGCGLAEEGAEVEEVGRRAEAFGAFVGLPAVDEPG